MGDNKKYKTVTVDFEAGGSANTPSCPDFIEMKKNPGQGQTKYDGVEFKAKQAGYTFTGIIIFSDQDRTNSPEWPPAVIGSDGNKSTLTQDDLYRDPPGETNHTYTISYTGTDGLPHDFDPGIKNQD
ncbi:MAG: hypothetical protein WBM45_15330 [Woeseiaceae bacterium]